MQTNKSAFALFFFNLVLLEYELSCLLCYECYTNQENLIGLERKAPGFFSNLSIFSTLHWPQLDGRWEMLPHPLFIIILSQNDADHLQQISSRYPYGVKQWTSKDIPEWSWKNFTFDKFGKNPEANFPALLYFLALSNFGKNKFFIVTKKGKCVVWKIGSNHVGSIYRFRNNNIHFFTSHLLSNWSTKAFKMVIK